MPPLITIHLTKGSRKNYRSEVLDADDKLIVEHEFDLEHHHFFEQLLEDDAGLSDPIDNRLVAGYGHLLHQRLFGDGVEITRELRDRRYGKGVAFEMILPPDLPPLWQVSWEYVREFLVAHIANANGCGGALWECLFKDFKKGSPGESACYHPTSACLRNALDATPYLLRPDHHLRRVSYKLGRIIEPESENNLRILLVLSNPLGLADSPLEDFAELDVETEYRVIYEACHTASSAGRVHLKLQDCPCSFQEIGKLAREFSPHIIHLACHGAYDPKIGACLVLEDDGGQAQLVTSQDLWKRISQSQALRLVVLSGCSTSRGNNWDAFSSIATNLLKNGKKYNRPITVIANQHRISDDAGHCLAKGLYGSLAGGDGPETAVSKVRQKLFNVKGAEIRATWGVSALYTCAVNDFPLVDLAKPVTPTSAAGHSIPSAQVQVPYVRPNRAYREFFAAIHNRAKHFIILAGKSGAGKTALLSTMLERLELNDGYRYLMISCGQHPNPASTFLKLLAELLRDVEGSGNLLKDLGDPGLSLSHKIRKLAPFCRERRFVFAFDGFDFLLKPAKRGFGEFYHSQVKEIFAAALVLNWGDTSFVFARDGEVNQYFGERTAIVPVSGLTRHEWRMLAEKAVPEFKQARDDHKDAAHRLLDGSPLYFWYLDECLRGMSDSENFLTQDAPRREFEREKKDYVIGRLIKGLSGEEQRLLKVLSVMEMTDKEVLESEEFQFSPNSLKRLVHLRLVEEFITPDGAQFRLGQPYRGMQ